MKEVKNKKGGITMTYKNPAGKMSEEELKSLAGGNDAQPNTWTIIVPISLAVCPTTTCASITRPCPN